MKNSRQIPIQTTVIQRRKQKEKGLGRRPAMPGRKDNLGHVDADDVEEIEEINLAADQLINANANVDAGSKDLEDEEEVHDDNEELEDEEEVHDDNEEGAESIDDHPEKESSIEVDSDDDNMQTKFYKPPAVTSKKRKLRHSLSEAVAENRNNAR